ncbi:MAG: hypothetical protein H8D23_22640 [Candidatus Brocadiales bacterium]|nr:hypothetical protein [Candidatus Brocadiales bacterium]
MNFDMKRYASWIELSTHIIRVEKAMVPIINALGNKDCDLVERDSEALDLALEAENDIGANSELDMIITDSYLWILGMYELVRSLHQIARAGHALLNEEAIAILAELDGAYRRVRIPLAKLEPARGYEDTDWSEVLPILEPGEGIGWQLSEKDFVTRRSLSDKTLHDLSLIGEIIETRVINNQQGKTIEVDKD